MDTLHSTNEITLSESDSFIISTPIKPCLCKHCFDCMIATGGGVAAAGSCSTYKWMRAVQQKRQSIMAVRTKLSGGVPIQLDEAIVSSSAAATNPGLPLTTLPVFLRKGFTPDRLRISCSSTEGRMDANWNDLWSAESGATLRITLSQECDAWSSVRAASSHYQVPAL